MAHDFLGTFNKSQWDRFLAFARDQLPTIQDRIVHLDAEIRRVGRITFSWDGGTPKGFTAAPANSYLAKLLAAYEVLGGSPPHDLRTRLKTEPIFLVRGTELESPDRMSNGEIIGSKGLADRTSAELSRKAQEWLLDTMHWRFGRLERKIRRALDYKDQLNDEKIKLQLISQAASVPNSLENIAEQIAQLFTDPNYRAIFDDQGKDEYGQTSHAPFSALDRVKSQIPDWVQRQKGPAQRQDSGFVERDEVG
jgi:hypothetical protein